MNSMTKISNFYQIYFIVLAIFVFTLIHKSKAAAGYCYQCNSRNPKCGVNASTALQIDGTPCNGQCYIRINRDDEYTVSRGCSWEHGFMNQQQQGLLILDRNSIWVFCDSSFCNGDATSMLTTVCYQPICDYLNFPQDCKLPNADVTCGRNCNIKLCNSIPLRYRNRNRNRYRNQTKFNL